MMMNACLYLASLFVLALDPDILTAANYVLLLQANVDPSQIFSMLTYNILAECHRLRYDKQYNYTDEVHKDMDYRDYRILEEIKQFDCDIVCMQEVEEIYYRHSLIKSMQMYVSVYK